VENEKTIRIIASVNDITEKIALEKDLEETKEASKRKMDLLLSILNVEPVMLEEFKSRVRRMKLTGWAT